MEATPVVLEEEHQVVQLNNFPMETANIAKADTNSPGPEDPTNLAERLRRKGINLPPDVAAERIRRLDSEVGPLVMANANVLVEAHWMGRITTLEEAIITYPRELIEEDPSVLISVINGLLANRPSEEKESQEDDEAEKNDEAQQENDIEEADKKRDVKPEVQRTQIDKSKADTDVQSKESVMAKPLEHSISNLEEAFVTKDNPAPIAKAVNGALDGPAETSGGNNRVASDELAATSSESVNSSAPKYAINESSSGFTSAELEAKDQANEASLTSKSTVETKKPTLTAEVPETEIATNSQIEARPAPNLSEHVTDEEPGSTIMQALEATLETNPLEANIKMAETEDEPAPETLNYELDTGGITDFIEGEEVLLAYFEESDELDGAALDTTSDNLELEEASIFEVGSESNPFGQKETTLPERWLQTSVNIEEVEDVLTQLAEAINTHEAEETQKMNEILDKIIEVPVKLEANKDSIITESEAQLELEELFTELLDMTDIDYTPELIESLAQLTLKWHLTDDIEKLSKKDEVDGLPAISVTHEIINKILIALSTIKKAITHASAIGKSALQLYHFNFAVGQ